MFLSIITFEGIFLKTKKKRTERVEENLQSARDELGSWDCSGTFKWVGRIFFELVIFPDSGESLSHKLLKKQHSIVIILQGFLWGVVWEWGYPIIWWFKDVQSNFSLNPLVFQIFAEVWSVGYGFFWGPGKYRHTYKKQGVQGSLETEVSPKKRFFFKVKPVGCN